MRTIIELILVLILKPLFWITGNTQAKADLRWAREDQEREERIKATRIRLGLD